MDKKKVLKGTALVLAGALVGGIAGAGLLAATTEPVIIEKNVTTFVKGDTQIEYVTKEVVVEKNVTNTVTVEDTSKVDMVIDFIQDEVDEDISFEYIAFEVDAKMEGEEYIKQKLVSMFKEDDLFENGNQFEDYRVSEVSIKKIDDAVVEDRDFDDLDVTLSYEVDVKAKEDGEEKEVFKYLVTVPFEDGKMVEDDVDYELI